MKLPVSAIILCFNEEKNLPDCLASIREWIDDLVVIDSGSTDQSVAIARAAGARVFEHPFENYSRQRNWALQHIELPHEWVLHLDADHRVLPDLRQTLEHIFSKTIDPAIDGFMVSRRTIFLGKWIRFGGHYPVYHTVLFRKHRGYCEDKLYDQHFKVAGKTQKLQGDILDIVTESLDTFTRRHNHWAALEAGALTQQHTPEKLRLVQARLFGSPVQRRRFFKSLYEGFPLFVRPALYFLYRYFLRLGFLDGRRGLIFHVLQGFWFRFLIDAKVYELRRAQKHLPPD
ncbi:MAG: glycosyltransferase family 2 protein [Saprospiraceae bacterium]|nr:glycosyltransferase family 2 protein [Saprospiraceae bacterium]